MGRQEFSRRVGRDPKDTISNTIKESYTHSYYCQIVVNFKVKAFVRYFYQIFIFSPIDSPAKTMKNTSYFIKKALFVLEIIKFLYFHPSLFFFHCFRRWSKINLKVYDTINCLNKNSITHFVWYLEKEKGVTLKLCPQMEYQIKNIFMEKSCRKYAAKASPRPVYNFGK